MKPNPLDPWQEQEKKSSKSNLNAFCCVSQMEMLHLVAFWKHIYSVPVQSHARLLCSPAGWGSLSGTVVSMRSKQKHFLQITLDFRAIFRAYLVWYGHIRCCLCNVWCCSSASSSFSFSRLTSQRVMAFSLSVATYLIMSNCHCHCQSPSTCRTALPASAIVCNRLRHRL